jgi:fructokinase
MGDDDLGKHMLELLESRGVDLSDVQHVSAPTRDVLVTRDHSGDRTFAGFGKADNKHYADCLIDAAKLPHDKIKNATTLVTGTLGLAFPKTAEAMYKAVEICNQGPCSLLVDINWRPVFWEEKAPEASQVIKQYLSKAEIVKLTDEEAEFLFGLTASDALQHPEKVLEAVGTIQGVLVTAGGLGSSYAFKGQDGKPITGAVPVLKIDVVDTTGAGDAFLGGFLHSMVQAGGLQALREDPSKLQKAVEFATACGAFTCTKPGAIGAQPTLEEAQQLLKKASFADSGALQEA